MEDLGRHLIADFKSSRQGVWKGVSIQFVWKSAPLNEIGGSFFMDLGRERRNDFSPSAGMTENAAPLGHIGVGAEKL
ncbi:hypothetical protein GGD83_002496 [Rhodoblastus sphagnicola]|uniref:hypothetical protein n=1 Tax=Rhodoblastus sphagnicola TaxID=333368 RepID=UPI001304E9A4|nr:hypothetical protein [Rhodoblastus sphagnicola]MBB4198692.1 hypothetical protein [Rhodoblastus sphagnicola]